MFIRRFIHGVGRPDEILDCVECGVDLFDSSFPYEVAERGSALTFDHQYEPDPETAGGHLSPDRTPESNGICVPSVALSLCLSPHCDDVFRDIEL